ncbi:MAG: Hsp20/alpha crystallin family protein [Halobacteriaceae archaeon]
MALPTRSTGSWSDVLDLPNRLFEMGRDDYELYEEEDEFVLAVEMPGFDPEEITVSWDEGILNIAGEHEDEHRDTQKTYHRRFRFPKEVHEDEISAEYNNGILEIRLPVAGTTVTGKEIEIQT